MSKKFRNDALLFSACLLATALVLGANLSIADIVGAAAWLR
jgi:hypothetical protein